jgi:hypothetical protein
MSSQLPNIATWNLSDKNDAINTSVLTFGSSTPILALEELRGKAEPLVLYILAHAIPDGLKTGPNTLLDEATLVRELLHLRGQQPTVVIFDMCFAESFESIAQVTWPDTFVRIYCCKKHERTWHTGETRERRQSIFSGHLNKTILECRQLGDYSQLQAKLGKIYSGLQTPVINGSLAVLKGILG